MHYPMGVLPTNDVLTTEKEGCCSAQADGLAVAVSLLYEYGGSSICGGCSSYLPPESAWAQEMLASELEKYPMYTLTDVQMFWYCSKRRGAPRGPAGRRRPARL